jgi:uncharacterized protein (TIGR00251 family)
LTWHRFDEKSAVLTLRLYIQPGAKRTEVAGPHGGALKIRVAAPPVDGAANEALLDFLKKTFGVPLSCVTLKHGASGRSKVVEIQSPAVCAEVLLK